MNERQRKPWPGYNRKICHVVGDNSWDLSPIYEEVPDAPTIPEIVEVLREAQEAMKWLRSGTDWSTSIRIESLIERLEDA